MSESEEERFDTVMQDLRYYTFTIRPSAHEHMNMKSLSQAISVLERNIHPFKIITYQYEKVNTSSVHYHALLKMPYLKSKVQFNKLFKGFHTHLEIVRRDKENQVAYIWHKYITKELSDSDNYYKEYGNMIPLQD